MRHVCHTCAALLRIGGESGRCSPAAAAAAAAAAAVPAATDAVETAAAVCSCFLLFHSVVDDVSRAAESERMGGTVDATDEAATGREGGVGTNRQEEEEEEEAQL